jgi:hypothetical protein
MPTDCYSFTITRNIIIEGLPNSNITDTTERSSPSKGMKLSSAEVQFL